MARRLHAAQGLSLICGFYLNELMLKLLPRHDAHERLFDDLRRDARARSTAGASRRRVLRGFEKNLSARARLRGDARPRRRKRHADRRRRALT